VGIVALASALAALEITKRPRRLTAESADAAEGES
jgi:hypothetical protein